VDSTGTPEVLLEGGLSGLRLSRVLQSSFKVCLLAYLLARGSRQSTHPKDAVTCCGAGPVRGQNMSGNRSDWLTCAIRVQVSHQTRARGGRPPDCLVCGWPPPPAHCTASRSAAPAVAAGTHSTHSLVVCMLGAGGRAFRASRPPAQGRGRANWPQERDGWGRVEGLIAR
jgi:hypothetical protein